MEPPTVIRAHKQPKSNLTYRARLRIAVDHVLCKAPAEPLHGWCFPFACTFAVSRLKASRLKRGMSRLKKMFTEKYKPRAQKTHRDEATRVMIV